VIKKEKGMIQIVGEARTNGEIGRILECLLEVGIFGKVQYLETMTKEDPTKIIKIEIPEKELTPEKATNILNYMKNTAEVCS
jgi:hypothetical protein